MTPPSVAEAERIQEQLRQRLDLHNPLPTEPRLVAGVDVSYDKSSPRITAAAVVFDLATGVEVESAVVPGEVTFPYVPGLLAFREVPILLTALERLAARPDLVVCDGYGIAHPRRFGLACHLGVVAGLPTFGVAKTPFVAGFDAPGEHRGDWSPLRAGDEVLGRVLRTQTGVKPVFVSVGHRTALEQATTLTLNLTPRYRLPEVIRRADHLSREALRPHRLVDHEVDGEVDLLNCRQPHGQPDG
ncbi:endonuclease V [Micromonospora endophytica]|uniref:endonuclease V n=2 Tax=Micromonospora endophytica TaxID=515350 RepID=UPI001C333CA5|nr:endonuclease V [Micromonospora endophytica]BCJ57918.1 endonuclease V [Micromonospora endophytica]